jgi:aminopeptidase YwaD
VGEAFAAFVNQQSAEFAKTGRAAYPLVAPEGGKEALVASLDPFTPGSDHQVYTEGSWRIPAISLAEWPDRYIHTNFDSPANIDPTKLKRAGFIGAASGYLLATLAPDHLPSIWQVIQANSLRRTSTMLTRRTQLPPDEAANLTRFHLAYERALVDSVERFLPLPAAQRAEAERFHDSLEKAVGGTSPPPAAQGGGRLVFARTPELKGPMNGMGYDYFAEHYGAERARTVRLLGYRGLWGGGLDYAYEALNFVDGRRTAQEIRDALSAIYGPIPLEVVVEYLRALESIGVIRAAR